MRASDYCVQVHRWLRDHKDSGSTDPGDPRAVIGWYSTLVPAKMARAILASKWANSGDGDDSHDGEGSAKVALIGLERSHAAWLRLSELGLPAIKRRTTSSLSWCGSPMRSSSAFRALAPSCVPGSTSRRRWRGCGRRRFEFDGQRLGRHQKIREIGSRILSRIRA